MQRNIVQSFSFVCMCVSVGVCVYYVYIMCIQLEDTLKLSSRYVRRLRVSQLLPPPQEKHLLKDDDEG